MNIKWPTDLHPSLRVCHPANTAGTTWLRESDLVFIEKQPYAVFHWQHGRSGDVPDQYLELNPKLLKHDETEAPMYRYEGELPSPPQGLRHHS